MKEKELTAEQKKERYQEAILEGLPDEVKEMLKVHLMYCTIFSVGLFCMYVFPLAVL